MLGIFGAVHAAGPDCSRPYTLALHDHGLLYSAETGTGIDKDVSDELIRRSGCKVTATLMARARIWQLIESGALDFSLSGITNTERDKLLRLPGISATNTICWCVKMPECERLQILTTTLHCKWA